MHRTIFQTVTVLAMTAGALGGLQRATQSQERPPVEAPRIAGITPAEPGRSDAPQLLTVQGVNFADGLSLSVTTPSGATQKFEGQDIKARRPTTFQVSAVLSAAGAYGFVVTNPDGKASPAFTLSVQTNPAPAPNIDRVMPESVPRDVRPQEFVVEGTRFVRGLKVTLESPDGQSVVIDGERIRDLTANAFRMSAVLDKSGTYNLFVTNPSGASSNAVTIAVALRR